MHATRNPDGSFSHDGQRYRLTEPPDTDDTYEVTSETTGAVVGRFRILAARGGEPELELLPPVDAPEVLSAIAALLESPRGAVPLQ